MGWFSDFAKGIGSAFTGNPLGSISSVLGIGKGIASLFGGSGDTMSQQQIMDWQEQMMEKQQQFSADEAQKSRDWQQQMAYDLLKKNQDYNSIVSQVRRASKAGVNPWSVVDSGSYGTAVSQSAPSGAMASGAVSIPQAPPNVALQKSEGFNMIASALKALGDTANTGVDTDYLRKTLTARVEKALNETDISESQRSIMSVVAEYMPKKQQWELSKLLSEVAELDVRTALEEKQWSVFDAQAKKIIAEANLIETEREQLRKYIDRYFDQVQQAKIRELNTESERNLASAEESRAGAEESRAYASESSSRKKMLDLSNEVRGANIDKEKEAARKELQRVIDTSDDLTATVKEQLKKAIKDNDWYTFDKIIGAVGTLGNTTANVIDAVKGFKGTITVEDYDQWDSDGKSRSYHRRTRKK